MSSRAAVQLFLQRILRDKYLEEDTVDQLIRNISRGTGHDFGGKNGFIQETNRMLNDVGYMLVRVNVYGKACYSLKNLQVCTAGSDNKVPSDKGPSSDKAPENSSASMDVTKLRETRFSMNEILLYFDAISHILSTRSSLPFISAEKGDKTTVTWSNLCAKHLITTASSHESLAERLNHERWIKYDKHAQRIAPGPRFFMDFADNYDLAGHPSCIYCGAKIICDALVCSTCNSDCHEVCSKVTEDGSRLCFVCEVRNTSGGGDT